jgi:hypothetical protein
MSLFNDDKDIHVPAKLRENIYSLVRKDIQPDHKIVFFKLMFIQAVIGFMTMAFCPQFEMSLTNSYELFHFFHRTFGHKICMFICGSIFIGSGALVANSILTKAEIKRIKGSSFLYYMAISLITVSAFLLLSQNAYLSLVPYWFTGATVSGIVFFNLIHFIRIKKIVL